VIARQAPTLAEQGRPRKEQEKPYNVRFSSHYGNRSTYLAARLKRDRPDVLDLVDQVTVGNQGGPNNPWGREGKPETEQEVINHDIIMVDYRSVDSGPEQGTSATYALRRLRRERPDLHERVLAETRRPAAGYSQRPVQARSSQ